MVAEIYEIELQNATVSVQETQVYKEEREAELACIGLDWETMEIKEQYMTAEITFNFLRNDSIKDIKATRNEEID